MSGAAEKAAFRAEMLARRTGLFAKGQGEAARHLREALGPHQGQVLAGYMPMRTEIDPLAAMAAHQAPVGVPVILGPDQALKFREWTPGCAMVEGAFKAFIPVEGVWIEPEVLIVPLLAFDARGFRLGYGGGFYDRTLEALRAKRPTLAVGFAFGAQEVDAVPIEDTDQRLDVIVTEAGVRLF